MFGIKKFVVNPLQENTYLIYDDTKECIIVDAGFYFDKEKEEVDSYLRENRLILKKLVNTHCHFDHLLGISYLHDKYKVGFEAHEADSFLVDKAVSQGAMFGFEVDKVPPIDTFLREADPVEFGATQLRVIHVPGHSPGHVVLYSEKQNVLMSGDTLFYGSIGRTDLTGGDYNTLISGIKAKLLSLPDNTKVYSGHGPETSIGYERMHNPFLT